MELLGTDGLRSLCICPVYIKRFMDVKATRVQMVEMFWNVKQAFHEMLDQNEWMDEQTKVAAFEKVGEF